MLPYNDNQSQDTTLPGGIAHSTLRDFAPVQHQLRFFYATSLVVKRKGTHITTHLGCSEDAELWILGGPWPSASITAWLS